MNFIFFILALVTPLVGHGDSRVRKVEVHGDSIVTVRTALGIATIIQVPDRPDSVVVGDQSAFKVEYLDRAITIKPLHSGAKSNLYIYTDWKRFNVQLNTGPQTTADYVVYLENERKKEKPGISWIPFRKKMNNAGLVLEMRRLGHVRNGPLLLEFELRSSSRERIKPEWVWLTQGGATKPIHSLFLSGLDLKSGGNIQGVMQILRSDLDPATDFTLELRRKQSSSLTIPRLKAWK